MIMKFEVFDFEIIYLNDKMKPYAISYSNENQIIFYKFKNNHKHEVINYILENFKNNYTYYAHNLLFDYLLIIKDVMSLKIKYNWVFIEYELYELTLFYNNKIINLRCSYKLIPFALNKFYPNLSSKKKLYFPYDILKNWNSSLPCNKFSNIDSKYSNLNIDEYLKIYSINDSFLLKEGLTNFFNTLSELNIDYKKNFTCGGISLNYYIKNWNIINLNLKTKYKQIIRQAYLGGRCEIFGNPREGEKILHFDFKGMYQMCMLENLPYGDFKFKNADNNDMSEPGFYYIEIDYDSDIPILPLKEDKLYFKKGTIIGWFWYEEIILVLKTHKVNYFKIIYKLISIHNAPILYDFINNLAQIRDQGGIKKDIGKLLINSFYGRMGLDDCVNFIELKENIGNEKIFGMLENFFIIKKKVKKKTKSNIAIAAAITSKARIKLYNALLEVINNGGRPLYCDTDSVIASFKNNSRVEDKLLDKYVFFDTSKPDTEINDAIFINPKTYGLILKNGEEIIKIKGVNNLSIDFCKLKTAFLNKTDNIELPSTSFSKKNLDLNIFTYNKTLNLKSYNKRIWSDDYTTTKPLINKFPS